MKGVVHQMLEPMTVDIEVWPVAADELGLWLVSGDDAWHAGPVMADNEPHNEVENAISEHMLLDDALLLHSTSWRVDGPRVVLTYMALVRSTDLVREMWPSAMPINLDLAKAVGKPLGYKPSEPPTPRHIDVLMHGLRHLRFLMITDSANAAAMDPYTQEHLARLEPALLTMYNDRQFPEIAQPTPPSLQ
jgi:hypothetical protein